MKFSALNVDFSSPCRDPLGSTRPTHSGVKEGYPSKKWLFSLLASVTWKWFQIGTDVLLIMTSNGDELLRNVNIDDLDLQK